MKSFPMLIRTTDRTIVIAGGGEQAAQKARLILKTDALLRLVAPELDAELRGLVDEGRAIHDAGPVTPDTFRDGALSFIATGCVGSDVALHTLAREAGAIVNVIDRPDLCEATIPTIVDRDPVVVAAGIEGTAPVLARAFKTRIETLLPPGTGRVAALAGRLLGAVARHLPETRRRAFWSWVFNGDPARLVKSAISDARLSDGAGQGHIALVGAGPGARDLLTLRAVDRLQEADIIFYDRLVDPDVLELARRDAERFFVGKEVGASAWPQKRISALIVAEARKGRRVVRLKSGDPSIFGRATEELEAARAMGIAVEIVPGITAASAAAVALGRSLTERGETDTLVIATGTCRAGDAGVDWVHHMRPGTTLAVYMGVSAAAQIARDLQATGAPPHTAVEVVAQASTENQRILRCTLSSLGASLRAHEITGVALILVRLPKRVATSATLVA